MHAELEPAGLTVVTVALDLVAEQAKPWIEAAQPTHPSLVDSSHRLDELLGIDNVPMAVWIDENGHLVRPPETASIEESELRSIEVSDDLPERMRIALTEIKKMPDASLDYRAAIVDWAERGADSPFALSPDEVVARSQPRPAEHARAAACFELGTHLFGAVGKEAAIPWWKEAHGLHPENWTYKRQAWTLETTADGQPSDLSQEATDVYGTSWLDDVLALGGGANYGTRPEL